MKEICDQQQREAKEKHDEAMEEARAEHEELLKAAVEEAELKCNQQKEEVREELEAHIQSLKSEIDEMQERLDAAEMPSGEVVQKKHTSQKMKMDSSHHAASRSRVKPQIQPKQSRHPESTGETPEKPLGFVSKGGPGKSSSSNVDMSQSEKAQKTEKPKKQGRRPSTTQGFPLPKSITM